MPWLLSCGGKRVKNFVLAYSAIFGMQKGGAMQKFRKLTTVVAVTAIVAAGFPSSPVFAQARVIPTSATPAAPVDQTALISSTIKGFPNDGEPLKLAISDL